MRTGLSLGVVMLALVLLAPRLGARPETAAQAPQDVKGWHGMEWDMTPEQAASILGHPLGDPKTSSSNPTVIGYAPGNVSLDAWGSASLQLGFKKSPASQSGDGALKLASVILGIDKSPRSCSEIRDELKGTYGSPTSEKNERNPLMHDLHQEANWVLPLTQITLWRHELPLDPPAVFMYVRYSQRRASPF